MLEKCSNCWAYPFCTYCIGIQYRIYGSLAPDNDVCLFNQTIALEFLKQWVKTFLDPTSKKIFIANLCRLGIISLKNEI